MVKVKCNRSNKGKVFNCLVTVREASEFQSGLQGIETIYQAIKERVSEFQAKEHNENNPLFFYNWFKVRGM